MGKDVVWFLKRWAKTYLLVDENLYDQVRTRGCRTGPAGLCPWRLWERARFLGGFSSRHSSGPSTSRTVGEAA